MYIFLFQLIGKEFHQYFVTETIQLENFKNQVTIYSFTQTFVPKKAVFFGYISLNSFNFYCLRLTSYIF